MVALSLLVLLGFVGLTADVGLFFHAKRTMQTAADAAAIAGAAEYPADSSPWTLVTSNAKAASAANGYTDGSNGATVTVNTPATSGSHKGTGTVEVIVSQPQSTLFMALLGFNSMTVNARAVAVKGYPSQACLTVLSPNGSQALELQGKFTLSAPNCGVAVNSTASDAIDVTGNAGSLTAGSVGVVGGCSGKCTNTIDPDPVAMAPTSDPLYFLPAIPDFPTGCIAAPKSGSLSPNTCYSGDVTLSGTLPSGTYTFTGNVTAGAVTGTGVTLLLSKNASFSVSGDTNLTPPTSGTYQGVVIYQSRTNTNQIQIQKGSSDSTITGVIYAPSAQVYLQDNGGGVTMTADLVVGSLFVKASTLNLTSYSQSNGSVLSRVVLVE